MKGPYDDIIHMPHHVSAVRSRMSITDRAAQFSPFAALTGYEASIQEMRRIVDNPIELDVDGISMLNEKILRIASIIDEQPYVTVTCFVPDQRKRGGAYVNITGHVKRVDPYGKQLLFSDGTMISFDRIYDIEGIYDDTR